MEQLGNDTGSFLVWFRGVHVVLWLGSFGWRRLTCYICFESRVISNIIYIILFCNDLRKLLPDNLGNWWKSSYFICLRPVTCSSGEKTWRGYFKGWAAAWTFLSELF